LPMGSFEICPAYQTEAIVVGTATRHSLPVFARNGQPGLIT